MSKTVLTMNDTAIHSLHELREHFQLEEALAKLMDNSLIHWMEEHYYELEAEALSHLKIEDSDVTKKLCDILGIACESKQHIATSQEELATLLDAGITEIYLSNNTFFLPIGKAGIHYIGMENVTLEKPYTLEQYQRAGITIDNITVAEAENPGTKSFAQIAASKNGYDSFAESHSALTAKIHDALKRDVLPRYYNLPPNSKDYNSCFQSRHECEDARNTALQKAYDEANKYFSTDSSKSLAKDAATAYSEGIIQYFSPIMENLQKLFRIANQETNFAELEKLVSRSYRNLREHFEKELLDSADYYRMYDFDYFVGQTEIEKHDYRTEPTNSFFGTIESLIPGNIEYSYNGVNAAISELQKDLNEHAATFFKSALSEYLDYVKEIETLIESVGKELSKFEPDTKELSEFKPGEDINAYLQRQCVRLATSSKILAEAETITNNLVSSILLER